MGKTLIALALVGLLAVCLAALPSRDAGAGMSGGLAGTLDAPPLYTPVLIFKDCQRVALCTGCAPVYRCRSCEYKRICAGRRCFWGDVCIWGPYLKVLPRGARIIR